METSLLLTKGHVAVNIHHGDELHTLAEMEAVELHGEVGFFANGKQCADCLVVNEPAELLALPDQALLEAILSDSDLVVEMLSLVSERCRRGSPVIALLLSGIEARQSNAQERLEETTKELGGLHFHIAKASRQLQQLHQQHKN